MSLIVAYFVRYCNLSLFKIYQLYFYSNRKCGNKEIKTAWFFAAYRDGIMRSGSGTPLLHHPKKQTHVHCFLYIGARVAPTQFAIRALIIITTLRARKAAMSMTSGEQSKLPQTCSLKFFSMGTDVRSVKRVRIMKFDVLIRSVNHSRSSALLGTM